MSTLGQQAGDYPCGCGCGAWWGNCYGPRVQQPACYLPAPIPFTPWSKELEVTDSWRAEPSGFKTWRIKPRKRGK